MTFPLSDRDRRTLMVGLGVMGALLLFGRGVPVLVVQTVVARGEARALANEVLHARAQIASRTTQLGLPSRATVDSLLFEAPTVAGLASAAVQDLTAVLRDAKVRPGQLRADTPDTTRSGLVRIAISLNGECDIEMCVSMIAGIEKTQPAFRIARVRVSASDVAAPAERAERLVFELLVDGLGMVRRDP